MRAEKSQLEIQIKTSEMRTKMTQERVKENKQMYERKERLAQEIRSLEEAIKAKGIEKEELARQVLAKSNEVAQIKSELAGAEEEFSKQSKESSDKRAKLSGAVSSLRATIEGKKNEMGLRSDEVREKQERMRKLDSDEKESLKKIDEARKSAERERKELAEAEDKISSTSKAIEKLFERLKGYERELEEIGQRRGRARMRLEKVNRDFTQVEIKKATTSTRLEDIRSEFSSFTEFERIEGSRDELSKMVASSERTLASLGNVNMAAIEMYDKKRAEIDGVEERIGRLDKEREAILSMINEIEEHKKEAFFETFEAVSDNFRKMFTYVNVGEGHLYMNNPREPFESGLFIKLRRNNQEHSLDALSGGEKTLVALMFIFALQLFKPAPFYILDEVDAALDKPNSKNLADLVAKMSKDSQFILVSHNDVVMANSDSVIGVTKSGDISKLVGLRLKQVVAA
jgi:chromosome segregation protein